MTKELQQSATDFIFEHGGLTQKHTQNITQAFLDDLKDARNESTKQRIGERWMREGFDMWQATGPQIVKKLQSEDLGAFMATDKRI